MQQSDGVVVRHRQIRAERPAPVASITAAILVGGLGTRLRAQVPDRPKALVEIAGRPFLSYQLDQLAAAGVETAVLCTGYRGEQIRAAFGDAYRELRLLYSQEPTPRDTAGALRFALPLLGSAAVLVMNGDSLCAADLDACWRRYQAQGVDASMLVTHVLDASRYGRVRLNRQGRIVRFEEKSARQAAGWINAGVYVLSRRLIERLPPGRAVSLEREVFPRLAREGRLSGSRSRGRFLDIGTPESYRLAERFIRQGGAP